MSRYFSRLAQRSGLVPPMAVPARPSSGPADIVIAETHIESPSSGTGEPAAQPAGTKTFTPVTKQQPSIPTRKPATAESHSSPTTMPATTDAAMKPAPPRRSEQAGAPAGALNASSPQVVSATPGLTEPESAPSVEHRHEAASVALAPELASRDVGVARQAAAARSVQEWGAETTDKRAMPARTAGESLPSGGMVEPANAWQPASRSLPRAPEGAAKARLHERQSARIESYAPVVAPSATAVQEPMAATQRVEVRIGAVRLDIHAPQPEPTASAAPAPAPAREAPRFALRRHYLRG